MSSPSLHKQLLPIQRLKERLISGTFQRKKHALTLSDSQFVFFATFRCLEFFLTIKVKVARTRLPSVGFRS